MLILSILKKRTLKRAAAAKINSTFPNPDKPEQNPPRSHEGTK
jgi:hypothetical protein